MKVKQLIKLLEKYEDYELFVEEWHETALDPIALENIVKNDKLKYIIIERQYPYDYEQVICSSLKVYRLEQHFKKALGENWEDKLWEK